MNSEYFADKAKAVAKVKRANSTAYMHTYVRSTVQIEREIQLVCILLTWTWYGVYVNVRSVNTHTGTHFQYMHSTQHQKHMHTMLCYMSIHAIK